MQFKKLIKILSVVVLFVAGANSALGQQIDDIQTLQTWVGNHDPGTSGDSTGSTKTVSTPSLSGHSRQFIVSATDNGGEIFHTVFGSADAVSTSFVYDADILLQSPGPILNIEMDLNQVLANGDTVIFGVQCDGAVGKWDITVNAGTPLKSIDKWLPTTATCPAPSTWEPDVWHHVEITYRRDVAGWVTYESVSLDGNSQALDNTTVPSAFTLGWTPVLLTNFQIDINGNGGPTTVYVDNMTVNKAALPPSPSGLIGTVVQ